MQTASAMQASINFEIRIVPADDTSTASGSTETSAYRRFVGSSGRLLPTYVISVGTETKAQGCVDNLVCGAGGEGDTPSPNNREQAGRKCHSFTATSATGHSRLRWSRPRLVHVRFNSDSDRQPSKRDPALRANSDYRPFIRSMAGGGARKAKAR